MSYNYFESPSESAEPQQETNFQFGNSLLSATGQVERVLSSQELEAIQHQFMSAEHPVVPLPAAGARGQQTQPSANSQALERDLSSLLSNLKSGSNIPPELMQKLNTYQEEYLKEGASSNEESVVALSPDQQRRPAATLSSKEREKGKEFASPFESRPADMKPSQQTPGKQERDGDKKKSLIVYLNHPRPSDMSRAASSSEDSLAQLISEQTSGDPFVSAKEFDSHGLSKDTKHLDISSLRGLGAEAKDLPEGKDGLSVVVIGDAYKYKKIVLLISSKTGGLKFIPMVKDMRKR